MKKAPTIAEAPYKLVNSSTSQHVNSQSSFILYLSAYLFIQSYNRCTSSFLNNWVPGFMVAAVPQATPKRTVSEIVFPWLSIHTIPATMLSPAPTVLCFFTVGVGICSHPSRVTSKAPVAPLKLPLLHNFPA